MNGKGVIDSLLGVIAELKQERQALHLQLNELEQDIHALERSLNRYRTKHGVPIPQANLLNLSGVQAPNLYQRRKVAFMTLAKANSNVLIVKDAAQPMVAAGLYKDTQQFRAQAYSTIGDMDCWEKITKGQYRLLESLAAKESQPQLIKVR